MSKKEIKEYINNVFLTTLDYDHNNNFIFIELEEYWNDWRDCLNINLQKLSFKKAKKKYKRLYVLLLECYSQTLLNVAISQFQNGYV